jgi:hypothetical protein
MGIFLLLGVLYIRGVNQQRWDYYMQNNDKPWLRCRKCSSVYHYKVPVNWFLSGVLFFLPIKAFFCARCLTVRHHIMTSKTLRKYKPV